MKKAEIKQGGKYIAKVSNKITTVRVDSIVERDGFGGRRSTTNFNCTNETTGKKVTFHSATKFRGEAGKLISKKKALPQRPSEVKQEAEAKKMLDELVETLPPGPGATEAPPAPEVAEAANDPEPTPDAEPAATVAASGPTILQDTSPDPKEYIPTEAPGKLSALDAAAKVLEEKGAPMSCPEMIADMASKGYWSSPGGKTPASTLYAAIAAEIKKKGDASRFAKVDKGRFARKGSV